MHRPVSSPAIAGLPAIFSHPKAPAFISAPTYRNFFPARICRHFVPIRHCRHFFPTWNCRHIFQPEIVGISSDPKLPAHLPTRNCRHILLPETAGIFFRHEIAASKSSSSILSSVQRRSIEFNYSGTSQMRHLWIGTTSELRHSRLVPMFCYISLVLKTFY